ncbi:prepilin peptidase [Candidatus Gottesmanbacteria bacterium]|nr:prepilin peptidase [Candidatus Gottesmanbacteria bacterium]
MIFLLGVVGLVFGSFLNVLIWRLNDSEAPKFWWGRSICPRCKKQLAWFDNIPLLSFALLRGECRFCHQKISWQYLVVEALTAIAFVLTSQFVKLDKLDQFAIFGITAVFIVIFFSDLVYGLIPDEMIIAGVALGVILAGVQNLLFGFLTAIPFFIFAKLKLMGEGDIGLAFLIGLLLGWPKIIIALWSAFILGGVTAIILLLLKRTKLSATIPLGPFLIIGTVIAGLWSKIILQLLGFG